MPPEQSCNLGRITELVGCSRRTTAITAMRQEASISFAVFSANSRIADIGFVVVVPMKSLIPDAGGGAEKLRQSFARARRNFVVHPSLVGIQISVICVDIEYEG